MTLLLDMQTTRAEATARVQALLQQSLQLLAPPPRLTVSQWAEQKRYVSAGPSAHPGPWRNELTPYLVEVMDCVTDPLVERIVWMKASRIGGTEFINNTIGFHIDEEPAAILYVQQTVEMAERFSKQMLYPMIRDTPCLRVKVADARSRDTHSTILEKSFPGGGLTMIGANSPRGFRMTAQRIVICDDVDGFEANVGDEGDPVALAERRAATFLNRKIIEVSSPKLKGSSRIEQSFEQSDQRYYHVPCPVCRTFQIFEWGRLRWPSPQNEGTWYAPQHQPERARYLCINCDQPIEHRRKTQMLRQGRWIASQPFTGTAGFHMNALYSPFQSWSDLAKSWLKEKDHPQSLQVFINTVLAQSFEVRGGEALDHGTLYGRREQYGPKVPARAVLITAGVDVQLDRVEIETVAWGPGEESWGLEVATFYGDLTDPKGGAWLALDSFLDKTYEHESGIPLRITATAIDSGFKTKEVYAFCGRRRLRGVWAVKGSKTFGAPLIVVPAGKHRRARLKLVTVGVSTAKITLYGRLKKDDPGPGYMHFPMSYEQNYFKQLTAERLVSTWSKGIMKRAWEKAPGKRNEALDRRCYAMAALAIANVNLEGLAHQWERYVGQAKIRTEQKAKSKAPRTGRRVISRGIES